MLERGKKKKNERRVNSILLIGGEGDVCDVRESYHYCHLKITLALGGCGLRNGERGEGRGNYSEPISMRDALIKYSHRKLGPRSNASGKVPDRQTASELRKLLDVQTPTKTRSHLFNRAIHRL